ncbi:phage tail protein [Lactiplantibacillus plantarum]|uniref:phage tail protein n=1 Tax=Lactiplantibacillus plantarum TaxID=1590 RepID=UPI002469A667|nr:phage tail protein [Lactiplantibacillus plantarum]MDH5112272.1 phage tail protein [Lactiplantibacillus plantarum]
MFYLRDVTGNELPVIPISAQLTETVNQVAQLELTFINTGTNASAVGMLQPRTLLLDSDSGEAYRIQTMNGSNIGGSRNVKATFLGAVHDLNDHYVEKSIKGSQSLDSCMQLITEGTGFTYTIHDDFNHYDFSEDFGTGLAFDLFLNTLMSDFNFEWTSTGKNIDIYKQVGKRGAFVWLDGLNLSSLTDESDYTTIATHIKGTGKLDDKERPLTTAEYTSPNATTWGVIDAEPISDERFTNSDSLLAYLKSKLQDVPLIQRTATLNDFKTNSVPGMINNSEVGNYGYIRDRNGVDVETRISEIVIDLVNPATTSVTFGNMTKSFTQITAGLQTAHNDSGKQIEQLKAGLDAVDGNDLITDTSTLARLNALGGAVNG